MNLALAIGVVVGFGGILVALQLPEYAREVSDRSRACPNVLQDANRSDRQKEEALQQQARRLFALLGILGGGSLLALGLPLGAVWGLGELGIGSFEGTWQMLQRWDFLAGTVVVGTVGWWGARKLTGD